MSRRDPLDALAQRLTKLAMQAQDFAEAVDQADDFDADLDEVHDLGERARKVAEELTKEIEHCRTTAAAYEKLAETIEEARDAIDAAGEQLLDFEEDG